MEWPGFQPGFQVILEDDPVRNQELSGGTESRAALINLQAGDEQGAKPYISLVCSTVQIIEPGRVLLIWHASFHPGFRRRFQLASFTCKFLAANSHERPSIVKHSPRRAYGGSSKETKAVSWGVKLPLSFSAGPASAGVEPSKSVETSKNIEHTFTITGTSRGVPRKTTCVWTIEENESTQRGIPSEIQFATILEYSNAIRCEVNLTGRTGGLFSRWLRASTPVEQRQADIKPEDLRGLLKEFDFQGDPRNCDEMLEKWTGAVEGAVVEFGQPVTQT